MTEPRRRTSRRRSVRGRSTGSITAYGTKAGTRWRFQLSVPVDVARPEIGERKHSRAGFSSYEAADAELALLRADLMRKVPQPRGRDTFAAYGQRWLDGHAVGNGTRMYIQRVLDAMDPYIGSVPMADIRATDLAAAYRGLENGTKQMPLPKRRQKGLATSTVARYANWVSTIFLAALDEGIVARNPANSKHSGRPRGETAKRVKPFVIWNVEQLTSFWDWALADDEPWARTWILLSRTGLRSGEVLALRWGDIDFNKGEMRVERALHYDETLPASERFVIGSVEGGRPRTVAFDRTCAAILDGWRKVLPTLIAGGGGNVTPLFGLRAHDPVFPSLRGRAATQSGLHGAFLRVQKHYRSAHPARDLPRLTVQQPGDGISTVGDLLTERVEVPTRPERSAAALIDDVVAVTGKEARSELCDQPITAVRSADQYCAQRCAHGDIDVSQELHAVTHSDTFLRHGVVVAARRHPQDPSNRWPERKPQPAPHPALAAQ